MITTIIFDWGGVLTDGTHTSSIVKLLEKIYGISLQNFYEDINNMMRALDRDTMSSEVAASNLSKMVGSEISCEKLFSIFEKAINPNKELIRFIPKLKEKYRLLVLSNNNEPTVKGLRKEHKDMLDLFDKIYFSFEYKIAKPNRKFFELPLKELKLKPEECIFIDDKQRNIDAAEKIGLKGILFKNNDQLKQNLAKTT